MLARPSAPLRHALSGMIAMAACMGIGRFVYTPILPGMMEALGLSTADAGLIASANYLGYLLGAFAAAGGWAQGRERSLVLAGLAANALLAASMGLATTVTGFIVIRFLAGIASAVVMIFLTSMVFGRLAAAGRSDLQALHFGGVGVGIALSSAMMALLILLGTGWPSGWFGAGSLSAIGLCVVAFGVERVPLAAGTAQKEPRLPRDAALTRFIVAYGLFGFGYIVTATFLVAIVRAGGSGRVFETGVWMATGLAGIPSVFVWNAISRRIGLPLAFAAGCAVEVVGVIASVAIGGHAGPLIGGILLGGTFIAVTAIGLQAGRGLAPLSQRRVLALMTVSFGIGQILGPIAAGTVAARTGDFVLASGMAAAALLASGAVALSARAAPKLP